MKEIVVITEERLKALIREVYIEEREREQKTKKQTSLDPNKYYSRKETAELLQVTLPTLHKYVRDGIIMCHRIGNRVLFKAEDIDQAIVQRNFGTKN
jgi:excisionase family DNA binding protein